MRILFEITLDDHKAFQNEYRFTSREFLQLRLLQSIGGPCVLLWFVWISTYYRWGWFPTLISSIPAAGLGFYFWRESPGLWIRSNVEGMHQEGRLDGHLGKHSLEISADGIVEKNEAGEHFTKWNQIDNIHSSDQHTIFLTKQRLGYIVPHERILEGDYNAFLATAWKRWLERKP